jgi:GDP-L-fucose synthase
MFSLADKRILVTGAHGFLGSVLTNKLKEYAPKELRLTDSKIDDLRDKAACSKAVKDIDIVFHLAARVGGIGYNQHHPVNVMYDNILINTHMMHEASVADVKKFVGIGSVCAYPDQIDMPFDEKDIWNGYPEKTNAPYGLTKRMMLVATHAYKSQFNLNGIHLILSNLFGPGQSDDDTDSHVIPALMKKFITATHNNSQVVIWGTGLAKREFLYVSDAADAIIKAAINYDSVEPINIGVGSQISIKQLANKIALLSGFAGKIIWDASKPDGQLERKLNCSKMKELLNFQPSTPFDRGLKETYDYYVQKYDFDGSL